jgi:hypothetical protein
MVIIHRAQGGLAGNGKSPQAAVMFDLAGEKGPAEYFTRLTVASENQLEAGHTGHFFNGLLGPNGSSSRRRTCRQVILQ